MEPRTLFMLLLGALVLTETLAGECGVGRERPLRGGVRGPPESLGSMQALLIVGAGGGGEELLMQMQKGIILIITKKSKAFRRADEMQLEGKSIYKNVIL